MYIILNSAIGPLLDSISSVSINGIMDVIICGLNKREFLSLSINVPLP